LLLGCIPEPLEEVIPLGVNGQLDPEEGLVLLVSLVEGLGHTMETGEVQEAVRGMPHDKLARTQVQIQASRSRSGV
jgi:hypothetical protein